MNELHSLMYALLDGDVLGELLSYKVKGFGTEHNFERAVHLQLLPDGALRLTKHKRPSEQPPLLIWQGLFICGQ